MSDKLIDGIFGSTCGLVNINSIIAGVKRNNYHPISSCFFKKADSYSEIGCRAVSVVSAPIASTICATGCLMFATYKAVAGMVNYGLKDTETSKKNFNTAGSYFTNAYSFLWFALISSLTNLIDTIGVLGLKLKEDFTSHAESTVSKQA